MVLIFGGSLAQLELVHRLVCWHIRIARLGTILQSSAWALWTSRTNALSGNSNAYDLATARLRNEPRAGRRFLALARGLDEARQSQALPDVRQRRRQPADERRIVERRRR